MIETLQRFGDVVIADVAQGRNMYQMPLNVFCVVDGAGRTRNVAYVVQDRQDHDAHQWALQQLVSASGSKPSVIMSDQDAAFMSAVRKVCPDANHLLCLWHLWKNVRRNLVSKLRDQWSQFCQRFWLVYRAPSPKAFETRWNEMLRIFPRTRPYLETFQYPNRRSWAAAWTRTQFTANTRTTGRVESENGVNKMLSSRKTTLMELFPRLLQRAAQQGDSGDGNSSFLSRNADAVEDYFQEAVDAVRAQCTIWPRRQIHEQMSQAMFYRLPQSMASDTLEQRSDQEDTAARDKEENGQTKVSGVKEPMPVGSSKSPRDSDTDREEGSPFDEAGVDDDVDMNIQEDEDIARELPNDEQNTGLDAEYLADMIGSSGLKLHRWYIDPTSAAKSTPIQLRAPALAVDPPEKAVPVQLPGNTDIENAPTPGPGFKMPKVHAYHRATAATNNIMKALSTETRVKKFETMLENFLSSTDTVRAGRLDRNGRTDASRRRIDHLIVPNKRSTALRSPVLAPTPQPPRHAASASTATASNSVLAPPPAAETLASFEGPLLAEDVAAGVYGGYTIQRTLGIGAFSRVVFAVRPDSTLSPDLHAQLLTTPPPSPAPAAPT
ncbi:hypothetical protein CF328_g8176 [Tilletia controversa]|nr:hypothetical protein CF328_g8176 [Tilletia controversa]